MFKETMKKNTESIEIFDTPIYFIDGMARLKDIQMAYLSGLGDSGSRSEGATRPAEWRKRKSTMELMDYLENEDEVYSGENATVKVHDLPLGDRGGLFVCRELAHDYAMWLDKRYAVSVLRAFDLAVSGQMFMSATEANKVAKRVLVETWNSRAERLASKGWEVDDAMYWIVNSVAPVCSPEDMKAFLRDISEHSDAYAFFDSCCHTLETAIYFTDGDLVKAEDYLREMHSEDPRRAHLDKYLEKYTNG